VIFSIIDRFQSLQYKIHDKVCRGLGFCQEIRRWLRSYLNGRKQRVRDLGIMVAHNLKSEHQVMNTVAKASMALSILGKTFKNWTPRIFKSLYTAFIRPHLEYDASAWSPYLKKDIQALENAQRRATKRVKQLKNLSYEDRLKKLNLTTLEERRTRGDLIQFSKILSNINTINWHLEPTIDVSCRPKRNSNQNRPVQPPPATERKLFHV